MMVNKVELKITDEAKKKIERARLVEKDGKKTLELKFCENVPREERNIRMGMIVANLIQDASKEGEENEPFRELLEGLTVKEWEE